MPMLGTAFKLGKSQAGGGDTSILGLSGMSYWVAGQETDSQNLTQLGTSSAGDAQFGSTSGADSNDPTSLSHTGTDYLWFSGTASNTIQVARPVASVDVVITYDDDSTDSSLTAQTADPLVFGGTDVLFADLNVKSILLYSASSGGRVGEWFANISDQAGLQGDRYSVISSDALPSGVAAWFETGINTYTDAAGTTAASVGQTIARWDNAAGTESMSFLQYNTENLPSQESDHVKFDESNSEILRWSGSISGAGTEGTICYVVRNDDLASWSSTYGGNQRHYLDYVRLGSKYVSLKSSSYTGHSSLKAPAYNTGASGASLTANDDNFWAAMGGYSTITIKWDKSGAQQRFSVRVDGRWQFENENCDTFTDSLTEWYLGGYTSAFGDYSVKALGWWKTALTDSQIDQLEAYNINHFGSKSDWKGYAVFGDSISKIPNDYTTGGAVWHDVLQDSGEYNGFGGYSKGSWQLSANELALTAQHASLSGLHSRNKSFVLLQLGINDIGNGRTAAQLEADVDTFISQVGQVDGWPKVVVFTLFPASSLTAGEETERLAYNTAIRARDGVDLLVYDADALMNDGMDALKSEYDSGDGVHPNAAGQAALGASVKTYLDGLYAWSINRSASGLKSTLVTRPVIGGATDDYLEVADHADLDVGSGVDFWVAWYGRYHGTPGGSQVLVAKKADLTTGAGYAIYLNTSRQPVGVVGDGANDDTITGTALGASEATLIVFQRNGSNIELIQVDAGGTLSATPVTDTTGDLSNALTLRMGRLSSTGTNYADSSGFAWCENGTGYLTAAQAATLKTELDTLLGGRSGE